MYQTKKLLVYLFVAICVITMGGATASAAETKTAKQIVKKALSTKQKDSDNIVINVKTDSTNELSMDGYSTTMHSINKIDIQTKNNSMLGKINIKVGSDDSNSDVNLFMKMNLKSNEIYTYVYDQESQAYIKSKLDGTGIVEGGTYEMDYCSLYPYMSKFKYSNQNAKKDGKDAYYITAKVDMEKFVANSEDASLLSSIGVDAANGEMETVLSKVKIYVDKETGKLISLSIDFTSYLQANQQLKNETMFSSDAMTYTTKVKEASLTIKLNPAKYTKIKLPKNVVEE